MIFKYYLFLLFCFTSLYSLAQATNFTAYEKGISSRSTLEGEQSLFFNPAGIVASKSTFLTINYSSRFGLKDLQSINAGMIYPSELGAFGLSLSQFGNDNYRSRKVGISYAKKLFDKLNIGVRFNAQQLHVVEFEDAVKTTFDIGLSSYINDKILISFYTSNPLLSKTGDQYNNFDFNLGVKWLPSDKAHLSFEISKNNIFKPLDIRLGFLYNIKTKLSLLSGFSTGKKSVGFGVKYSTNKLGFIASTNYSFNLGIQPSIGFDLKL